MSLDPELAYSATPTWLSHKSTKSPSGESRNVPVIQIPRVRLLDQPLHEMAIVSLHQTDKGNSEAPH
jgi:hypothetical protein